jgi:hypothetical protein
MRAAVGSLHDSWSAACQCGESGFGQLAANGASKLVIRVIFLEPGRAEDSDSRAYRMKGLKGPGKLLANALEPLLFFGECARLTEEFTLIAAGPADGKLVPRQANFAPMFLPTAIPIIEPGGCFHIFR